MVALWLCAGGITGVLSGLSLRWTVGFLRPGATGRVVILTMAGAILRWVLTASLLVAALQRGAAAALLAFFGLWLARWGVVYWANRNMCIGQTFPKAPQNVENDTTIN